MLYYSRNCIDWQKKVREGVLASAENTRNGGGVNFKGFSHHSGKDISRREFPDQKEVANTAPCLCTCLLTSAC